MHIFREEGKSAKTTRRDEFQRMLQFCADTKNAVGYIVVYDLSRFARNMFDQLLTERQLLEHGVHVESVMEPAEDSAAGRFQRNMLASLHQFDNDRRAERTVTGMTQAAKMGRFPFKAPIGYLNVSSRRGRNLIPEPKTAPLVRKAFELFATGQYSKAELLKRLNSMGLSTQSGKPVTAQTFQRMLMNPIYAGFISVSAWGLVEQGSFDPIVSKRTFDLVQDVLKGRRVVAKAYDHNNPDFPLRVFVHCGICGSPLTGGWSTGKRQKYAYYRCRKSRCDLASIGRDDLEAKFIALLKRLTPASELVTAFTETVKGEWTQRKGDADAAYTAIQRRLAKAKQRKDRLVDLRLDGELSQAEYSDQNQRLTMDIEAAELELRETESQFLDLEGVLTFAEKIITSPARLWLESSLNERQRLQQTFFPDGVTFDGREFGTPSSSSFFSLLGSISNRESHLASPTGFEPVLSP